MYSLIVLTYAFVVLIGNFGVPVFVASTIGKRRHNVDDLLRNSLFVFMCSTVLLVCVFLALRGWLGQRSMLAPFLGLLIAVVPLGLLREHLAAFFLGLNMIGRFSLTKVIGQIVTLFLLLVFLLSRPDIWTAFYCWLSGEVVCLAVTVGLIRSLAVPGISFSPPLLKESLRFGAAVWLGSLMGMASLRLDVYIVAYFLGASGVGLYSVATAVSSLVMYLPSAMAVALLPRFSSSTSEESYELVGRACRVALLFGFGCSLILLAVGGVFIKTVYGSAFSPSVRAMAILLPGTVFYGLAHITSAYFSGFAEKPLVNALVVAVSLAVGIALDLLLIPTFGISGASLACSAAYLLSIVVTLSVFAKVSGRTPIPLLAVRKDDFCELARFVSRNVRALTQ
jgi:O-antigen/teichoic acid export membrane protein